MRVHVLQHVPFEGVGSIGAWLEARGARITRTELFDSPRFPNLREVDWLVVMGGPMSVEDEGELPWLAPEKRFIADAIAASKGVLGICLGAQLIASALGAKVRRNPQREIGWFPVEPADAPPDAPFAALLRAPLDAFHWHGETFELPAGAVQLARSGACEQQAFSLGPRVLGLQYHLEPSLEGARTLVEHCPADLVPGPWVQPASEMLRDEGRFRRANRRMDAILERLAEHTLGPR
jgi:GMP synthase-like glutamine amidotransferase